VNSRPSPKPCTAARAARPRSPRSQKFRAHETSGGRGASRRALLALQTHTVAGTSHRHFPRFRRFIDAQLQIYAGCASDECAYLSRGGRARPAASRPLRLRGGASALARALTDSIKLSGGRVRFDTTALRLAFDSEGASPGSIC
jgi:hypothetical protein